MQNDNTQIFSIDIETIIKNSLQNLQIYDNSGNFRNESNFKHELFHGICSQVVNGIHLGEPYNNSKTSVVHCESKVENGSESSRKADLIFCNPLKRMSGVGNTFNYHVEAVCELKKRFSNKNFTDEIDKCKKYNKKIEQYFFIEPFRELKPAAEVIDLCNRTNIKYLTPLNKPNYKIEHYTYSEAVENTISTLTECLSLYGHNNSLFQSFYWCNYEHELGRGVTFPSEGDFNAHVYHRLKTLMPFSHIETELIV